MSPEVPRFHPGRTYLITSGETTTNGAVSRSRRATPGLTPTLRELLVSSNQFPHGLGRHSTVPFFSAQQGKGERGGGEGDVATQNLAGGVLPAPGAGAHASGSLHTPGGSVFRLPSETGHHPASPSRHQILRTVTLSPEEQETGRTHPEGRTAQTGIPESGDKRPDL